MSEQVVLVGTYTIPEDKAEAYRSGVRGMTEFVAGHEPGLISFNSYISEDGTEATTIMIHSDSQSLEQHLEVAASGIAEGTRMVQTKRLEIYGRPSERLVEQLRSIEEGLVEVKTYLEGWTREECLSSTR